MTNDAQREVWSAADVAETWPKTEAISDQGTPLLMEALRLQPGEHVLDVACGGGKTTMAAARAVGPSGHVTGVDISKACSSWQSSASPRPGCHRSSSSCVTLRSTRFHPDPSTRP